MAEGRGGAREARCSGAVRNRSGVARHRNGLPAVGRAIGSTRDFSGFAAGRQAAPASARRGQQDQQRERPARSSCRCARRASVRCDPGPSPRARRAGRRAGRRARVPSKSIAAVTPVLVARIIGRAGFQRAHPRDLQVLRQRVRIAEPGDVADVGEDGGAVVARQRGQQFLAEDVLVADVERDALVPTANGGWSGDPRPKSPSGNGHQVDEPPESPGHELAEGHQVALVVARRPGAGAERPRGRRAARCW